MRYPVLVEDVCARDRLCRSLASFGASPFYAKALADIDGVAKLLGRPAHSDGAREFAQRLLTLPLHAGVGESDLEALSAALTSLVAGSG